MTQRFLPRRSCLYMPGSNSRALEKAQGLPADVIIMDLEDAVAPESKDMARDQVVAALTSGDYGYRECWVRINALSSQWGEEDLRAVIAAHPTGIVLPKVEEADDIVFANNLLNGANLHGEIALWAMIESPLALMNLGGIAERAGNTRLQGLIVGTNDLAKDLRITLTPEREALRAALSQIVYAARAYGLEALDGVYNAIDNLEGLRQECIQGRNLGFDGKTLIHPAQLATANTVFSPPADALADAQAIVDAFSLPDNQDAGVIKVNGRMTERLHLMEAQRLLDYARALTQRQDG